MTDTRPHARRVCVVIPTYNEAENIAPIVRAVAAELDRLVGDGYRILVVDDGSPDGTGAIADRLADEMAAVAVLHRAAKDGLGRAYLAGFSWALRSGADLVIEMDADFSHDPAYLGDLIAAAADGDLVLGSRYVEGGGVQDWGLLRRLISRGGGLYARLILGIGVHDLTGGFKCIRREVLEAIDLDSVGAEGYVFQVEVTYRAHLGGFRIREIPIVFRDRTAGKSKMSARIAAEAIWLVPRLRRASRLPLGIHPRIDFGEDFTPRRANSDRGLSEDDEEAACAAPFSAGERVIHPEWGPGTVGQREAGHITVVFDSVGYRTPDEAMVREGGLPRPGGG
jgi:dolichol-phosphate mannosyltransferase